MADQQEVDEINRVNTESDRMLAVERLSHHCIPRLPNYNSANFWNLRTDFLHDKTIDATVTFEDWLKSIGRIPQSWSDECSSSSVRRHHAFSNCFLASIAVHFQNPDTNPVSILNQICSHAREMAKFYSAFLYGGEKKFLLMIDCLEHTGDYSEIEQHIIPVFEITEGALGTDLLVVNRNNMDVIFGDKDRPITSETIILSVNIFDNSFCGTKTVSEKDLTEEDTEELIKQE
ncbi:uncharacterized protein [Watersipora subatra]|uniref:uncharacterized protein isoform X2 n=1 Tax=Watersipora subatra TaxID=2589382 RepID=UPI00355B93D5